MLDSEKMAIAAHLHVLLRRKTGRVTDVEWMVANAEYATEVVRFSRAKAAEESAPDLAAWADKLEAAMATSQDSPKTLFSAAAQALRERGARPAGRSGHSGFGESQLPGDEAKPGEEGPRYIGRLR